MRSAARLPRRFPERGSSLNGTPPSHPDENFSSGESSKARAARSRVRARGPHPFSITNRRPPRPPRVRSVSEASTKRRAGSELERPLLAAGVRVPPVPPVPCLLPPTQEWGWGGMARHRSQPRGGEIQGPARCSAPRGRRRNPVGRGRPESRRGEGESRVGTRSRRETPPTCVVRAGLAYVSTTQTVPAES